MEPKDDTLNSDRMRFVVAIMTKDYAKAMDLGTSIMVRNPNDHHVSKCLAALETLHKPRKVKLSGLQGTSSTDNETDESASGTKESDEVASSSR